MLFLRRGGARPALRLRHRSIRGREKRGNFADDVGRCADKPRPVPDELQAPGARAAVDATRQSHHDAAHVGGARRRYERAALERRLYRDNAARERRDRVVALRESLGIGTAAERELADDSASLLDDLARKRAVLLRIELVKPRADHADGLPLRGKCAAVRLGVYAERKPRNDNPALFRKPLRNLERLVEPVRRRAARADDGDRRRGEKRRIALDVERERMGRLLEKLRRIRRVDGRDDLHAVALRERKLALPVDLAAGARDLEGIRLPRGRSGTCRGDKLRKLDRTDLVRQIERHERFTFRDFALLIHHPAI